MQPDVVYFEPHRLHDLSLRVVIRVPPDLAIEVLSPATASIDRGRKRHLLARYGVREYWLVDPEERAVEIHALEGTVFSLVGTVGGGHAIASPLLGHMTDPVAGLFHSPI